MKSRLALLIGALALITPVFAAEKAAAPADQPEISVIATVDEHGVPLDVEIERIPSSVSALAVRHYVKKNLVAVGASDGDRIRMQFNAAPVIQQTWHAVKPVAEYPRTWFATNGPAGMPPRGMGRGF
ncbi:MAG: hypothetical protein C0522_12930 [Rhodocyclaceae bacterium]|nr:hypothetical protein [Rhodocyclaceae bacterium]